MVARSHRLVIALAVLVLNACLCTPVVEEIDADAGHTTRDSGALDAGIGDAGPDAGSIDADGGTDGGVPVGDGGATSGDGGTSVDAGVDAGITCTAPMADCDGIASNGCETNLTSSVTHCGSCEHACATVNTVSTCVNSACMVTSCTNGAVDCNHGADDGCELVPNANCTTASLCRTATLTCAAGPRDVCTPSSTLAATGAACGDLDGGTCTSQGTCRCPADAGLNTPCGFDSVCSPSGVCKQNKFWTSVACATPKTGNALCREAGFDAGITAWGYSWSECGGPNTSIGAADNCYRYSADRSRCTSWQFGLACNGIPLTSTRYGVSLAEFGGSPDFAFVVRDFFAFSCSGYNAGYSVRVTCEF